MHEAAILAHLSNGPDALGAVVEGGTDGLIAVMGSSLAARLEMLAARTHNMIVEHWAQVTSVAEALLASRTISGRDLQQFLSGALLTNSCRGHC
jgi:hypothetical protein